MAKVLISVDMEGVSGVVHGDHTGRDGKDYDMARRLMTLEANAAVEGAFQGGAQEVVRSTPWSSAPAAVLWLRTTALLVRRRVSVGVWSSTLDASGDAGRVPPQGR